MTQKTIFRARRFRAWMRYHGLTAWSLAALAYVTASAIAFGLARTI